MTVADEAEADEACRSETVLLNFGGDLKIMNLEASKREGRRSDRIRDDDGWESGGTTWWSCDEGDNVSEPPDSMVYPEDLDSRTSGRTQNIEGSAANRLAPMSIGMKDYTERKRRRRLEREEEQIRKGLSHTGANHFADNIADPAGNPVYLDSLGSDPGSRSGPTARSRGTFSDSETGPELGIQYPKPVYSQPKETTIAEDPGAGWEKLMRQLRSRSGGRRRPDSQSSSERDTGKSSRSRSRVREDDAAAFSTAVAIGIQQDNERKERRETERESERKRERPQLILPYSTDIPCRAIVKLTSRNLIQIIVLLKISLVGPIAILTKQYFGN